MIIADANRAAAVIQQAGILANNAAGGNINAFDAEDATRALRQYVAANQQDRAMQLASGMPVATQLDAFLKDNGDLRRLVNGSRLDLMTVDQRVAAITRWMEDEMRNQQGVNGVNPSGPNEVSMANIVSNMSDQGRIVWANKIALDQANGSTP
ncbi:MAG: hypothetical protein FD135_1081 [Comamonadaceae bacterium]|nr:MAG: hypothetical protein FD135_1081 [Comamonadaceae bacterium]